MSAKNAKKTIAKTVPYVRGFPVYMSRYVIFLEHPARVALHFCNGSDVPVSGLGFILTEKDAEGKTIGERRLDRAGFLAEKNTEFAVADAAVGDRCVAVEVRVEVVISDGYEYVLDDNGAKLRFGTETPEKEVVFSRPAKVRVHRRRKWLAVLGVAVVFGLAAAAGFLAWRFGMFDEIIRSLGTGGHIARLCAAIAKSGVC